MTFSALNIQNSSTYKVICILNNLKVGICLKLFQAPLSTFLSIKLLLIVRCFTYPGTSTSLWAQSSIFSPHNPAVNTGHQTSPALFTGHTNLLSSGPLMRKLNNAALGYQLEVQFYREIVTSACNVSTSKELKQYLGHKSLHLVC